MNVYEFMKQRLLNCQFLYF